MYAYHYILWDIGSLYHTRRKIFTYDMFSFGCGFVEYHSVLMRVKYQLDIKTTETVKEKITFDREDQSQGVAIER